MNSKIYQWQQRTRDKCYVCGENDCETEFFLEGSKNKILVRDCQPETTNRLPKYLRDEIFKR